MPIVCVPKATGVDAHNLMLTGDVSMTVTGGRVDGHSVPCVVEAFPMNPPEIEGGEVMTMDTSWFDCSTGVANTLKAHDAADPMCVVIPIKK